MTAAGNTGGERSGGDWTETFFDEVWYAVQLQAYDAETSDAQGAAVAALLDIGLGDRVLDVPCGEGRIARALARRGALVTGLDRSADLLARVNDGGPPIAVVQGDMRHLEAHGWDGVFDAAVNFWGSFGYFSDAENEAMAAAICRALVPGGRLLLDLPVLDWLLRHFQPRSWWTRGSMTVLEDRRYDPLTGIIGGTFTFIREGELVTREINVRSYSVAELAALLRRVGFSKVAAYGSLSGEPFTLDSPRGVVVATR